MRRAARWGSRDWVVVLAAQALLLVSFWGWYGTTAEVGVGFDTWTQAFTANAWQASTAWTAAVLLGAGAAVLWIVHRVGLVTSRLAAPAVATVLAARPRDG